MYKKFLWLIIFPIFENTKQYKSRNIQDWDYDVNDFWEANVQSFKNQSNIMDLYLII